MCLFLMLIPYSFGYYSFMYNNYFISYAYFLNNHEVCIFHSEIAEIVNYLIFYITVIVHTN